MKRAAFAFAILLAGSTILFAGPEPIRDDSKTVVTTPEHREMCNWTGFYIGANVGGAFGGNSDVNLNLTGDWELFTEPSDESFIEPFGSRDLDASGLVAGGFLGYNYQWHHWVFGVEASFDYVGLRDSFDSGKQFVNPGSGRPINVRQSLETNYLGTGGPRIGYAWDRLLLYATGGVAFGNVGFKQSIKEPEFNFLEAGSTDDTEVGWTVGGGAEYCLSDHWRARLEYRYVDLDCTSFSTEGSAPFEAFTGHHEACLSYHAVTAGIAYKF
jgi:outer membrane immunogenic protein